MLATEFRAEARAGGVTDGLAMLLPIWERREATGGLVAAIWLIAEGLAMLLPSWERSDAAGAFVGAAWLRREASGLLTPLVGTALEGFTADARLVRPPSTLEGSALATGPTTLEGKAESALGI